MNLKTGLVSYWKMNEVSGNRADSIGGHTLTDNNTVASASADPLGVLADFEEGNGDESLSVADHADFDFTTAMSWSMWVKPEALGAGAVSLISKFVDGSQAGYRIRTNTAGDLSFLTADDLTDSDDATCPRGSVSGILANGSLTHLGFVYDGTQSSNAEKLKIYKNAVLQTLTFSTGNIPATLLNCSAALVLGLSTVGGANEYDGLMGRTGVWNIPLTLQNLEVLYNGGRGLDYPFTQDFSGGII